jgi:alpha-galactosidase
MWCILAAPLMAGNDVRAMSPEIRAVLTDRAALAVNQDKLGKQGWRFRASPSQEIWVRELDGGDWAVALLNSGDAAAEVEIDWHHGWWFLGSEMCTVRDIWNKRDAGNTTGKFTAHLDSHDAAFLRLSRSRSSVR